jgi:adenylate cyclase
MMRRLLSALWRVVSVGFGRIIGLAMLVLFIALRAWDPLPVELLRLKTFDIYQIIEPREDQLRAVMVVDIDEASLGEFGQWPWPRTKLAQIVREVHQQGGVVIGFDILFPEHDRLSPARMAEHWPGLDLRTRQRLEAILSNDEIFAKAISAGRVVLGQSGHNIPTRIELKKRKNESAYASIGGAPEDFLIGFPGIVENISVLEDAALGHGLLTIRPSVDGIVRRVPSVMMAQGKKFPTLAIEMIRIATGQTTILIKRDENGINSLVLAGQEIPTDRNGQIWMHFAPSDPKRFVSVRDLLEKNIAPDTLKGKLVLVGTSALGLHDLKSTPLQSAVPGVEVHAQLIESILTNTVLIRPHYAVGVEVVLTLLVGLAIIILVPMLGALPVAITGAITSGVLLAGSWYLFDQKRILIDVVLPLGSSLAIFFVLTFINYFREEIQRNSIRGAFGQYLSPALVQQLTQNPEMLHLGGETRDITIMFSDVRQFTAISETFADDPQGLTRLMNRFLTPLSDIIMENKGTIDKYIGDAIMAFWNAPLDDDDHAGNACTAALQMIQALQDLNNTLAQEAKEAGRAFIPLRAGIGINTGNCLVGNLGSTRRFNYSALGDAVNLASRIEGLTKQYRLSILTGEDTVRLAPHHAFIEVDMIRVVGKQIPQRIFALVGGPGLADNPAFQRFASQHRAALNSYRTMDWAEAGRTLLAAENELPSGLDLSGLYDLYRERIRNFQQSAPPKEWDGVYVAKQK